MKSILFALLPISLLLTSCGGDVNPQRQLEKDIEKIQEYLDEKGLTAQSISSGLHYIIDVEGTGGNPTIFDNVTVFYKGYFLDEEVFDQTGSQPVTFPLANVIEGWQQGIPLLKKGGKGTLLIPSGLGYGPYPPPGIEKNAVLIFEVELVDF